MPELGKHRLSLPVKSICSGCHLVRTQASLVRWIVAAVLFKVSSSKLDGNDENGTLEWLPQARRDEGRILESLRKRRCINSTGHM